MALALFVAGCTPETPEEAVVPDPTVNPTTTSKYVVLFHEDGLPTRLPSVLDETGTRTPQGARTKAEAIVQRATAFEAYFAEVVAANTPSGAGQKNALVFDQLYSNAVAGFAATLTAAQAASLREDPRVALVELDAPVTLEKAEAKAVRTAMAAPGDYVPYGVAAVGGAVEYTGAAWAWVIDSGIDLDHPDLNVATSFAATFAPGTSNADDGNGHGTHVAGTIAAKSDGQGVIGVAANAVVVPVRVFDASGSSSNSVIIAGIDYVTANAYAGDVANLSLGGGRSTAVDDAVQRLAAAGVHVAIAAGNSARHARNYSPARANGTRLWTVSAHDETDTFARSFSNYGNPPIDVCAPGVDVISTYAGGGFASLSGTSMAAPHVAGILLVNNGTVYSRGSVKRDRDRSPDPLAAH